MPAFVVYINGWPGVGKLTVARELQRMIKGAQILHNHELIDPVEAKFTRASPEYDDQRALYRRARLSELANFPDTVYIFTDSQTEHNACVADYASLAQAPLHRRFYSVVLTCELEENVRRLTNVARGGTSSGKLSDEALLRKFRETTMITHQFGLENELVLDVTNSSAEDSAVKIANFVVAHETSYASSVGASSLTEFIMPQTIGASVKDDESTIPS